jgi:tRNA-specific 2-thiouridylase
VLDYEQRFKTAVIDAFAASYVAGETPVPCVTCNQQIKFSELLATARELEADTLATGHYIAPGATAQRGQSSIARAMPTAIRATSCSRRRAPSSSG